MIERADNLLENEAVDDGGEDLLWRQLKTVPAFRALLRSVEARFYYGIALQEPILDLGCGDGHFAKMALDTPVTAGADPWWGPLKKAQLAGAYRLSVQATGNRLPFPSDHFNTVISNSVVEHITNVQDVLNEAGRVLQPGGRLLITMPSHYFTEWLGGAHLLNRFGMSSLAEPYRRLFNYISRHVHTDPPVVWAARLAAAGFGVERWQYYFSQGALRALELGHLQGLPSAILHLLTGHWILAPWEGNLRRTERWVRPFYEEQPASIGAYILMIATKKTPNSEGLAALPPAQPFDIQMLEQKQRDRSPNQLQVIAAEDAGGCDGSLLGHEAQMTGSAADDFTSAQPESQPESDMTAARGGQRLISFSLTGLSLMFAAIGQSVLSEPMAAPESGLRWYGLSLAVLSVVVWRNRSIVLPVPRFGRIQLGYIPRRRWLLGLALLFAFWAERAANGSPVPPTPTLIILVWLTAAATAFYALDDPSAVGKRRRTSLARYDLAAAGMLFFGALLLRAIKLTGHPFVINGVEASLGLDAINVANGILRSPFAAGWLTNPTLPAFLLALPMRLLGPSVLSVRLLSPWVGAITVVLTFLVARKLWSREVGVIAALLLAGSHFHLQYSRLGMTNIWDPLLILVAFALLAQAWLQTDHEKSRRQWLWAGSAVGMNIYFFTSSRLLPPMLLLMLVWTLLAERDRLVKQWRNIAAAMALAVIVALPQLVFYLNHSHIFVERANVLGILDGQSGWLQQQSERTGVEVAEILRSQLLGSLLAFNINGDQSSFYKPGVPLLGFGPAILFVLGLATALLRWRRPAERGLVVWTLIVMLFAGALLIELPSSHRLLIATPALSMLAAIALVQLGQQAANTITPGNLIEAAQRYLLPILLFISLLFSANDILFYFGRYQNQHSFGDRNTEIAHVMSEYLNTLDGPWTIYFYGPPNMYVGFPTISFLSPQYVEGINLHDVLAEGSDVPPAATTQVAHIFLPERGSELANIEAQFPLGQNRRFPGYFADPLFYAYEVRE